MREKAGHEGLGLSGHIGGGRLFDLGGVLLAFAVVLALKAIAFWAFATVIFGLHEPRDGYSTDPIAVDIGTVGYEIPGNYVSVVPQGEPGGYQFVNLMVLRQGFEPRTRENAAEWRTWDEDGREIGAWNPGGTIRIKILSSDYPNVGVLENHVRDGAFPAEATDCGLVRYAGGRMDNNDLAYYVSDDEYRADNGDQVVIICDPSIGGMTELYGVAMDCRSGYRLPDGAWVRYEYYTNDLSDWRQIDERVRALISSFARTQPTPG